MVMMMMMIRMMMNWRMTQPVASCKPWSTALSLLCPSPTPAYLPAQCSLTCKTTKCSKLKSKYSDENTLSLLLPISLLTQSQKCKMFQNIKSTILRLLTHSRKSNTIAVTSPPFTESSPLWPHISPTRAKDGVFALNEIKNGPNRA